MEKEVKRRLEDNFKKLEDINRSNKRLFRIMLINVALFCFNLYFYFETKNVIILIIGYIIFLVIHITVLNLQKLNLKQFKRLQEEDFINKVYGLRN